MRYLALLLVPLLGSGCAADQFYDAALRYEASQPVVALEYYVACLELEPQHELARPRFDNQDFYARYVQSADAHEANGDYVAALGVYDQLVDVEHLVKAAGGRPAPINLVAKRREVVKKASRQEFTQGEELRTAGEAKAASKAFRAAVAYDPRNAQARARYREERAKATQRVAVLPFEAQPKRFARMARQLSDSLVAKAIAGQPEFLQFVDRNNLDDLLDEHELNATGIVDASTAASAGKLLGVNALVYGTLRFDCSDSGWIEEGFENSVVVKRDDGKGGVFEETLSATYTVSKRSTVAVITARYQVISVETGEILAAQDDVSERIVDEVRYARLTGGHEEAVPGDVARLLTAEAREPGDPNLMAQQVVKPLAKRLAGRLLKQFR